MFHDVVIIGNSGAGRECYWLLQDVMEAGAGVKFKGFLAFEGFKADLMDLSQYALGSDDAYSIQPNDVFVIAIGKPELRMKAYAKWKARGASFFTLTHPTANINKNTLMGEANIFTRDCYISCDVTVGNANFFNGQVAVGHDCSIGDGNFFAPFSLLLSSNRVGSRNAFGARSVLLPGAKVGNDNTLAAGAFLYKGCRDNCVMAGNPAQNMNGEHE